MRFTIWEGGGVDAGWASLGRQESMPGGILTQPPFENGNGEAMPSSPWEKARVGNEAVAARFGPVPTALGMGLGVPAMSLWKLSNDGRRNRHGRGVLRFNSNPSEGPLTASQRGDRGIHQTVEPVIRPCRFRRPSLEGFPRTRSWDPDLESSRPYLERLPDADPGSLKNLMPGQGLECFTLQRSA